MLASTSYSRTAVPTAFFMMEYHKSEVSGGFIYLKPDAGNNPNLGALGFSVQVLLERPSV